MSVMAHDKKQLLLLLNYNYIHNLVRCIIYLRRFQMRNRPAISLHSSPTPTLLLSFFNVHNVPLLLSVNTKVGG